MNEPEPIVEQIVEPIVVGVAPKRDRVTRLCTACEKRYHQKRGFRPEAKCKTCVMPHEECLECIEQWGLCPACRRKITGAIEPRKHELQVEREQILKQVESI